MEAGGRAARRVFEAMGRHPNNGAPRRRSARNLQQSRRAAQVAWLLVALIVQKFGGTAVGDPDRIRAVADHVARTKRHGDADVSSTLPGREMDMLITAGERKSMALMCMALHDLDVPADSFTGSQAGFLTDTTHGNARILEVRPDRVRATVDAGRVAVVGGSQGVSTENDVTFLGRGGSDTTAVALAHALGAAVCELYTDVTGVFTTDPRLVPTARRMASVSFEELLEMTASGCPKPSMRSVEYARTHGVRLHVRSAFTWQEGTWVDEEDPNMEQAIVSAVTHDTSEAKMTIAGVPDRTGVAATVFRALADLDVNVDLIVQNVSDRGVTDISFTVPKGDLDRTMEETRKLVAEIGAAGVDADAAIARVSIVGAGMRSNPGVAATMFETLAGTGVNIQMISTSAIRVSCVVAEGQVEEAVTALHEAFGLADA